MAVLNFLFAHWAQFLALSVATTSASQLLAKLAVKYPRLRPLSAIVTALSADIVEAIKIVNSLRTPAAPPPELPTKPSAS